MSKTIDKGVDNLGLWADKTNADMTRDIGMVCIGDSFTAEVNSYVDVMKSWYPSWGITNAGNSGDTTDDMLARIVPAVANFDPTQYNIFTVMGGANDWGGDVDVNTADNAYNNIGSMVDYALANGADVAYVICQHPFTSDASGQIAGGNRFSFDYLINEKIESNEANHSYTVINIVEKLCEKDGSLQEKYYMTYPTNVHPNDSAQLVIAKGVEDGIFGGDIKFNRAYDSFNESPVNVSKYGLWAYYDMGDFNATTIVDSVGANDITHASTYAFDSDVNAGCVVFGGATADNIGGTGWSDPDTFSVGGWFKSDADWSLGSANDQMLFAIRESGATSIDFSSLNASFPWFIALGSSGTAIPSPLTNSIHRHYSKNSEWNHYAITFDRSALSLKFFIDGNLMGESSDVNLATLKAPTQYTIGAGAGGAGAQLFEGRAMKFFIYSRTLSEDEVLGVYQGRLRV